MTSHSILVSSSANRGAPKVMAVTRSALLGPFLRFKYSIAFKETMLAVAPPSECPLKTNFLSLNLQVKLILTVISLL